MFHTNTFFNFSSYSKSRLLLIATTGPVCRTAAISRSTFESPRDERVIFVESQSLPQTSDQARLLSAAPKHSKTMNGKHIL